MSFEYNGDTYHVTPAVVEEALHLSTLNDQTAAVIYDSTMFEFVKRLGYNGEVKRYGKLFRTKLKKEWNFFFDTISRCFLNKTSNFDALCNTPRSGVRNLGCHAPSIIQYLHYLQHSNNTTPKTPITYAHTHTSYSLGNEQQ
ncbi:hypothetical protein POM88_044627 [Heracleum sosnowskyi]|uniref:Uncharacterized protein n=1 Tax=Heracleum sosnowskyi TaxID=360622 RepID=A0AAD8M5H8_9APIA|nr:hypothetical protein POM88_044627 [Heracleum sosnowskyi]